MANKILDLNIKLHVRYHCEIDSFSKTEKLDRWADLCKMVHHLDEEKI
jgi:hypothetical protein